MSISSRINQLENVITAELPVIREYLMALNTGSQIGAGTVFPVNQNIGTLFWRTDYFLLCFYDGTRWLSVTRFYGFVFIGDLVTDQNIVGSDIPNEQAIQVEHVKIAYATIGTNNASNYWTIQVRGVDSTYANVSTIYQFNTSTENSASWRARQATPNGDYRPTHRSMFDIMANRTGAPTRLIAKATIAYRLIVV